VQSLSALTHVKSCSKFCCKWWWT